jgi:hypothetical protein
VDSEGGTVRREIAKSYRVGLTTGDLVAQARVAARPADGCQAGDCFYVADAPWAKPASPGLSLVHARIRRGGREAGPWYLPGTGKGRMP